MPTLAVIPTPPPFRCASPPTRRSRPHDGPPTIDLAAIAEPIATLDGLLLITVPYGLVADSWLREEIEWDVQGLGLHLGDLARAAGNSLASLGSPSKDKTTVTLEHGERTLALTSCCDDLLIGFVFSSAVSLGMVRLDVERARRRLVELSGSIGRPVGPPPRTERAIPAVVG